MPLDFPNVPTPGQVWIASNGVSYVWDGSKWVVQAPAGTTGTVVNTFNTRAGNVTLTNNDVTTALGYTPTNAGHTKLINVLDYGATGNGTTDDTAAFLAAITAGRQVYVPAGRYLISQTLFLPSNTRLFGDGSAVSIIMPSGIPNWTGPTGDVEWGYLLSNPQMKVLGSWSAVAPSPSNQTDHDISVEAIGFDFTHQEGGLIARFCYARNIYINDIRADLPTRDSTSTITYSGFNLLSCDNVWASNVSIRQGWNVFDMWGGMTRVKIINMNVEGPLNPGNGGAINYNGQNTVGYPDTHSRDLLVENCSISGYGGSNGPVYIFLDGMSGGSSTEDVAINNVHFIGKGGTGHNGIVGRALGGRIKVSNLAFKAAPNSGAVWGQAINFGSYFGTNNQTGTSLITTTNGSNVATANFASGTALGPNNCISIDNGAGAPVVGNGVSLQGYYKVLSTGPYNSSTKLWYTVTFQLPNNATATGPITATTRLGEFLGTFNDCIMSDIVIDAPFTSGAVLFYMQGSGHDITDVIVTQNYPAAYYAVVDFNGTMDQLAPWRPTTVTNMLAPPGPAALPGGWAGDHVVCWQPYGPTPIRLNVNGSSALTGTQAVGTNQPNYITIAGGAAGSRATITTAGPWGDLDISPQLNGQFHSGIWRSWPAPDGTTEAVRWDYILTGATGGQQCSAEYHSINSDDVNGGCAYFNFAGGPLAGAVGGRTGFGMNLVQNGATTCPSGEYYVAGAFWVTANYSAGGSAGNTMGSLFASNDLVKLQTGAGLYWEEIIGYELDISVQAGTGCSYKRGIKIITGSDDVVSGNAGHDYAYSLASGAGAVGWDVGYAFGDGYGTWPMKATGTMIGTVPGVAGPAYAAAWGIDFSTVAFSGGLIRGPSYSVDGSGHVAAAGFQANTAGINFNNQVASGPQDLSKHINLYQGQFGFCMVSGAVCYNTASGSTHNFYSGPTFIGQLSTTTGFLLGTGNLNFNNRLASVGTDLSQGIQFYSGYGLSCSSDHGGAVNIVTGSTVQFYVGTGNAGHIDASGFNGQIGVGTPAPGVFTSVTSTGDVTVANGSHLWLVANTVGLTWTGAQIAHTHQIEAPSLYLTSGLGVFGATAVSTKPTVTGAKGGNAALASLITALASYGFITDSTT